MKKYLLALTILILWRAQIIAQTPFTSIKLGETSDLQQFNLGDSLLISYFLPSTKGNSDIHGGVIVHHDGSYKDFFLADIPSQFCGTESKNGQLFLYFIERKKSTLLLRTLICDRKTNTRKVLNNGITINGRLIGVNEKNGISIFTWNSSERKLSIYKVSGGEHSMNSYQLPKYAMFLEADDFQIMSQYPGWLYQSNAKAKIYVNDKQLTITIDRKFRTELISFNEAEKNYKVTTIGKNLTRGRESAIGSFICDSLLFRMDVPDDGVRLSIFTIKNGRTLASKTLYIPSTSDTNKIYFHSGKKDITERSEKLKRLAMFYGVGARPSIIATKLENGNYCVTLGSFYNQKGVGIVGSANPVTLLIGSFVMTAIKQARKAPAVSRYIYSNYNGRDIDFKNEPSVVFKAIDDFDISKPKGSAIEDVLIEDVQNAIIAFRDLNSDTLQLIKVRSK